MGINCRTRSLTAPFCIAIISVLVSPTLVFGVTPVLVGAPVGSGGYYGMYDGYSEAAQFTLSNSSYVTTVDVTLFTTQDLLISLQNSLVTPTLLIQSTARQNVNTSFNLLSIPVNRTLAAGTYYIVGTEAIPSTSTINVPGWFLSNGTTITTAGSVANGTWFLPPGGTWTFQSVGCGNPPTGPCPTPAFAVNGAANLDISLSAFIQSETVDGPGGLFAPLANAAPLTQQLSYGLLGAAAGITCGVPPIYGFDIEALRYSGNNRSFDPAATSYKIQEKWTLSADDTLYPNGLVGTPLQRTVPSKSWAPNSFSGGALTTSAKAATTPTSPRCNLLFAQATPNLSLTPLPAVTRNSTTIANRIQVQVGDPLVFNSNKLASFVPNLLDYASPLRADLTLTIDVAANTFQLVGTHTCYPAFELYLNNSAVYTFSPTSDSFVTIATCLALRSSPLTVNISGQVPKP